MKAKILVIGDAPLVNGLRLAGLEHTVLTNESGFQKELETALSNSEYGIIVANEYMITALDWKTKKKLDTIAYPVVVPIPNYSGESAEGDQIRELIKRALGFDLGKK